MAYEVQIMPSAEADLKEYADHIASESQTQARKWLNEAWKLIFGLADYPKKFAVCEESEQVGEEVRDVVHYSHRIVYRIVDEQNVVQVLRVWHGSRRALNANDFQETQ